MEIQLSDKIRLFNEDNMEGMKRIPDKYYDLAVVDPEYGRGEHGGTDRTGFVKQKNGARIVVKGGGYKKKDWDNKPASEEYFNELFRVSKNQIIWGCNYFSFPFGSGRIIWDKVNHTSVQSDCEIAYNSLNERVDLFRFMWNGMLQGKSITEGYVMQGNKSLNEKRIHPTQKPVALYKWLLNKYAKPGWKIIDTHAGSLSIGIACHELGFELDAWEIDQEYYFDSINRFRKETAQVSFFDLIRKTA